jgi:serine phosphatase RsbU (regulator of sigma subunit)
MQDYDVDKVLQRALDRLALLADATSALASTLDVHEGLRRVCRMAVPQVGDWCVVDLLGEQDHPHRVCVAHRIPDGPDPAALEGCLPPLPESDPGPLARVLSGAGPLLLTDIPEPEKAQNPLHARQLELFKLLAADTAIIAPLRARRQVVGALTVARTSRQERMTEEDLALVDDLAHRIALTVDNARLHHETQRIAERLQLSLLPELPGHLDLAARYLPSRTTAEVGGDWYDSFELPRGDTTLIIGDVTGHDLRSAVTMSQLRNMLRGIACDRQEESPDRILRHLDATYQHLYGGATASCIYAVLGQNRTNAWQLAYANAGHPPALLTTREGDTRFLEGGHSALLGVDVHLPRSSAVEPLPARSTLLLYTDGLVERRGEPLDHGLTRLRQHAAALAREPLDVFCDELLTGLAQHSADDIALLALRVPDHPAAQSISKAAY